MSKPRRSYRKRALEGRKLHPETQMMSYGYDPALSEGAVKCPIFQTSTFVFKNAEDGKSFFEVAYGLREKRPAEEPGLIYSRINNPDLEILEDRLTLWDEAEAGLVFCSGMAAISTTLLSFLVPGDVLVHSEPLYGGTEFLVHKVLPRFGIERVASAASTRRSRRPPRRAGSAPSTSRPLPTRPTTWWTSAAAPRPRAPSRARTASGPWSSSTTPSWGRSGSIPWPRAPTSSSTRSPSTSAATAT
jgi:hypothetical protein